MGPYQLHLVPVFTSTQLAEQHLTLGPVSSHQTRRRGGMGYGKNDFGRVNSRAQTRSDPPDLCSIGPPVEKPPLHKINMVSKLKLVATAPDPTLGGNLESKASVLQGCR